MDEGGNPPCTPAVPEAGSMEQHCRFLSARSFLEKASGVKVRASSQADLAAALRDGDILCRVAAVLHGDASLAPVGITGSSDGMPALTCEARVNENFSRFSLACAMLHVHSNYVVTKEDVVNGNMTKLVNCILELERYSVNMRPPPRFPTPSAEPLAFSAPSPARSRAAQSPQVVSSHAAASPYRSASPFSKDIVTSPLAAVPRTRRVQHPSGTPSTPSRGTNAGRAPQSAGRDSSARRGRRTATSMFPTMAALVGVPMGLLDLVGGGTGAGCGAASAPTSGTPQPAHMSKMEARAAQDDNNNATLLALNRAQEKATQDLRKEHAELTAALAKEKDRAQRLAASEGHLRVRLKNLEAQRGTTDSRVENLTARFRRDQEAWHRAEDELKKEVAAAEGKVGEAQNRLEAVELQLKATKAEQEAALQAVKRQQGEWADREAKLLARNKELFGQIEELQEKVTSEFEQRRQACDEASSLRSALRAAKEEAEHAKAAADAATATAAAQAAAQLSAMQSRAEAAEAASADLRARVEALTRDLAARDDAVSAAQAQISAARGDAEAARQEAATAATRFQASAQLRGRMGQYFSQVRSAASSVRTGLKSLADDVRDSMGTTAQDFGRLGASLVTAVSAAVEQRDRAITNFQRETAERRRVFNLLQEARGNIRVYCRVRPLLGHEKETETAVVAVNPNNYSEVAVECDGVRGGIPQLKKFEFDHVFGPDKTQEQFFEEVSPFVTSAMDGYHACIFAYGQTGSGKTHTMEGPSGDRGVYYRALHQLFHTAHQRRSTQTYTIKVSMVEIYNETVRDLLSDSNPGGGLDIRQGPKGVYIEGVTVADAPTLSRVHELMAFGGNNRAKGATDANEFSSRSHSLVMITLEGKNTKTGARTSGKLVLVDLAGSERLAKSHATGDRLKEAKNINRSLSALGDVISALVSKSSHIPFRNSKLTYLLKDSLGKDNKALMIVQASPTLGSRPETLCSLNFATRVGTVEQGSAKRSGDSVEVTKLRSLLHKQKQHEERLAKELRQAQHAASKQAQEAEKLVSEMRTHQQATTRLSVTVSAKERELASLHAEIASLHAKSGKSESRVEGMKERLDQATADADEWRSKAGELERQLAVLADKEEQAAKQLEQERNAHWKAQNAESGLREEAEAAAADARKWSSKARKLESKVTALKTSVDELTKSLRKEQAAVAKAQQAAEDAEARAQQHAEAAKNAAAGAPGPCSRCDGAAGDTAPGSTTQQPVGILKRQSHGNPVAHSDANDDQASSASHMVIRAAPVSVTHNRSAGATPRRVKRRGASVVPPHLKKFDASADGSNWFADTENANPTDTPTNGSKRKGKGPKKSVHFAASPAGVEQLVVTDVGIGSRPRSAQPSPSRAAHSGDGDSASGDTSSSTRRGRGSTRPAWSNDTRRGRPSSRSRERTASDAGRDEAAAATDSLGRSRTTKRPTTAPLASTRTTKRNKTLGSASRVLATTPRRARRTASRRVATGASSRSTGGWKF